MYTKVMGNILMVIAPKDFRDEEYFTPYELFKSSGASVTTASTVLGAINGSHGGIATAILLIKDVSARMFDCVVFVGGPGSYDYDNNPHIHKIAQDFYSNKKLTTAICHAPILLAKSGILHDKRATVFKDDITELRSHGAHYIENQVVVDGIIITANGPMAAKNFANSVLSHLDNH